MVRLLLMMVFNCATECEDMLVKELRPYNYQLDQLIRQRRRSSHTRAWPQRS